MTPTCQLIPAIDLLDGRCVRLFKGDFQQVTHYDALPAELAARYAADGAEWLHVVDLAASRDGSAADQAPLFELLKAAPQRVQTGGGVRNSKDLNQRLVSGADRVVVGSLSAREPARFARWLQRFGPDRLVAALDVQLDADGLPWPRVYGWTERAEQDLWTLLDTLVAGGLRHALITDIGRDGAMSGPNLALYGEVLARYPQLRLQASGGVSRLQDLTEVGASGAAGVIVGKALLDGVFSVPAALEALA